jgi:hypothetical protein
MRRGTTMKRSSTASPKVSASGENKPQVNLADKLIETIRNLSSNRDLLSTRISLLNGEGLKTASIMEIAGLYRSLVSQVAVMYDTDDFQNIVAPFIEKRFIELGSPSLTPGTIGSYIFGCYLSDYGMESLDKFCTPICAASIRVPNRNRVVMRCTEKVIWTDGGDTPIFILIDEDPNNSTRGKVFIPWVGAPNTFKGLTQGAVDEIQSFGVDTIEIYGHLFNNKYVTLMPLKELKSVPIVERIRIRYVDYVNSKNGGYVTDKCPTAVLPEGTNPDPSQENGDNIRVRNNTDNNDSDDAPMEKKNTALFVILGLFLLILIIIMIFTYLHINDKGKPGNNIVKESTNE